MGTLQGYVPKSFNSFRVCAFAMYQMCRVILMVFSAMPDNVPGIREWNSTMLPLWTRARIQAMHVNPNYVVYNIAKNACKYCRHIKILKYHSMRIRFFRKWLIARHSMQSRFFYKMTNRANKIDKKGVNLDMEYNFFKWLWSFFVFFFTCQSFFLFFFCGIQSCFFF